MEKIILIKEEDLVKVISKALSDFGLKPPQKKNPTYTINQVAKQLKMAHATVKKLVAKGMIRSTTSGRIPQDAIEDYLKGK